MIGFLNGIVIANDNEGIILDVNGVGYVVLATSSVVADLDSKIKVFCYTDVKENSISLFGFSNRQERQVFLQLKKVKGIGPKTALSIVSQVGAESVLNAIGRGDVTALKKVSGVGGKTAERIILELRESVRDLLSDEGVQVGGGLTDVELALQSLGFGEAQSRTLLERAVARVGMVGSEDLLRAALAEM